MNKIGVIAALPLEARCLASGRINTSETIHIDPHIRLTVSGVGPAKSQQAAKRLLDESVTHLVSWGVAAALDYRIRAGDVVLAEQVLDTHGRILRTDPVLLEALREHCKRTELQARTGPITETTDILDSSDQKNSLHQSTGAIAADMESAAIAAVAFEAGIPFLPIRVISDDVSIPIPAAVTRNMDADGNVKLPGLLLALLRQPSALPVLITLARGFKRARWTLGRCAGLLREPFPV
ncbi:MAG: hypothetical protein MI673_03085 [Thiotrichales bacterium]|nr:hypothetical protein [Thiotrichales bacterium]